MDADVLLTAASFAVERGDLDLARRHLTIGLAHDPRNWRLADAMAWIARRSGKPNEAAECLRRGIASSDDPEGRSRLLWVLADLLIDQGELADAKTAIDTSRRATRPEGAGEVSRRGSRSARRDGSMPRTNSRRSILFSSRNRPYSAIKPICSSARCYEQLGDVDRRYSSSSASGLSRPRSDCRPTWARSDSGRHGQDRRGTCNVSSVDRSRACAGTAAARLLILRNLRRPWRAR